MSFVSPPHLMQQYFRKPENRIPSNDSPAVKGAATRKPMLMTPRVGENFLFAHRLQSTVPQLTQRCMDDRPYQKMLVDFPQN